MLDIQQQKRFCKARRDAIARDFSRLNPEQQKAVLTTEGPLLLLAGAGAVALAVCLSWRPWCPVNKKIWTSTFVLASAAYSYFALALFYWIIDVKGCRRWTFFFRVIGMNAITIYMLMRIVDFHGLSRFFLSGVAGWGGKPWETLVFMAGKIVIEWLLLWYLYRNKTFLRV